MPLLLYLLKRATKLHRLKTLPKMADIAKGTFYYHFDSKEAVVVALRIDSFRDSSHARPGFISRGE